MLTSKPSTSERRRRIARRIAFGLGFGLSAFFVLYLVAANLILKTHRLDHWLTGATEGLYLRVDSGWTIWPGRVHVRGVELHFEDYNLQFEVALESGVVDIALLELPRKIFHLTRVRAQGVRYLFRHKVQSEKGLERRLERYPKIAGYSDPPLFRGEHQPPLSDAEYNLWTIQLEDVDAIAKELWFLEYRFLGHARARGGFRLQPERDAQTERCSLSLDGKLLVGSDDAASHLVGRIEAQLDRHDPRKVEGAQIFSKISFESDLTAQIPDLSFSKIYGDAGSLQLRRGRGSLRAQTDLRHGAWQEHSLVQYQTAAIDAIRAPFSASGPLAIRAEIVKGGRDARLQVSSAAPRLGLGYADGRKEFAPPSTHDLLFSFGATADLTQPIRVIAIDAHTRAGIPELRWFNHGLHDTQRFSGGSAQANLNLRWSEGELARGHFALELKDAGVAIAERTLLTSGKLEADGTYSAREQHGRLQLLRATLPELAITAQGKWKALPGGARAEGQQLTFRDFPPRFLRGDVTLESGSLEPLLPLVVSSALLRGIATAITHFGPTRATLGVTRTPRALTLELKQARSGNVTALGVLRDEAGAADPCGRFFIQDTHLSLGVLLYRGETTIEPFVSSNFWRERPPLTSCGPEALPDGPDFYPDEPSENASPESSAKK